MQVLQCLSYLDDGERFSLLIQDVAGKAHFFMGSRLYRCPPAMTMQWLYPTRRGNEQRAKGGGLKKRRAVSVQNAHQDAMIDVNWQGLLGMSRRANAREVSCHIAQAERPLLYHYTARNLLGTNLQIGIDAGFQACFEIGVEDSSGEQKQHCKSYGVPGRDLEAETQRERATELQDDRAHRSGSFN